MNQAHVAPDGAMAFWDCGVTVREQLRDKFAELGLLEFMPPVRSDADCLKSAIGEYCDLLAEQASKDKGKDDAPVDRIVQGLKQPKKNGYPILDVTRGEDDNNYGKSFSAKIETTVTEEYINGRLEEVTRRKVTVHRGYAHQPTLQHAFEKHKTLVTGSAVSSALQDIILQNLGGLKLNSKLFWIPPSQVERFSEISLALERLAVDGDSVVTPLTYELDERGINALKNAIIDEVVDSTERIQQEIAAKNLGRSALTTRQLVSAALHARVSKFEEILGEALTALHEAVRVTEEAAASAIAVVDAEEVFDGVF